MSSANVTATTTDPLTAATVAVGQARVRAGAAARELASAMRAGDEAVADRAKIAGPCRSGRLPSYSRVRGPRT